MKDKNILFINACVRDNSRTLELAKCVLDKLEGQITEIDLYKQNIKFLDYEGMKIRAKASRDKDYSDPFFDLSKQFAAADIIVIAAPFWDLMFPSVLKTYFESITVSGITFKYSNEGRPVGLCLAEKLYYITTSGGYIRDNNFGFSYIKALGESFFGIKDYKFFSAEGLDIIGNDVSKIMKEAKEKIDV